MKKFNPSCLKLAAIGFACLIIGTAILRTFDRVDMTAPLAGAIMLSILIASTHEAPQASKGQP